MLSDREFFERTKTLAHLVMTFITAPLKASDEGNHISVSHPWVELADDAKRRLKELDAVKKTTPNEVDAIAKVLEEHRLPMCRARLLHCLAAAHEQGTLRDVFKELLDDGLTMVAVACSVERKIERTLEKTGWARKTPKAGIPKGAPRVLRDADR